MGMLLGHQQSISNSSRVNHKFFLGMTYRQSDLRSSFLIYYIKVILAAGYNNDTFFIPSPSIQLDKRIDQ